MPQGQFAATVHSVDRLCSRRRFSKVRSMIVVQVWNGMRSDPGIGTPTAPSVC